MALDFLRRQGQGRGTGGAGRGAGSPGRCFVCSGPLGFPAGAVVLPVAGSETLRGNLFTLVRVPAGTGDWGHPRIQTHVNKEQWEGRRTDAGAQGQRQERSSWTERWTPAAPRRGWGYSQLHHPQQPKQIERARPENLCEGGACAGCSAPDPWNRGSHVLEARPPLRPVSGARQGQGSGGQPGRPQLEGDVRPWGPQQRQSFGG